MTLGYNHWSSTEEKIKRFADSTQFNSRKDLGITIEVGYKWDSDTQARSDELEFKVFAYRNRDNCAPAPTIEKALENATAAILRIECKKCHGKGFLCEKKSPEVPKGNHSQRYEYEFLKDDHSGELIECDHAG